MHLAQGGQPGMDLDRAGPLLEDPFSAAILSASKDASGTSLLRR